jgi:hypothetical protein
MSNNYRFFQGTKEHFICYGSYFHQYKKFPEIWTKDYFDKLDLSEAKLKRLNSLKPGKIIDDLFPYLGKRVFSDGGFSGKYYLCIKHLTDEELVSYNNITNEFNYISAELDCLKQGSKELLLNISRLEKQKTKLKKMLAGKE